VIAILLLSKSSLLAQNYNSTLEKHLDSLNLVFPFGVASGDPTDSSVILWTRLWLPTMDSVQVKLMIYQDSLATKFIQGHTLNTSKPTWWNVKTTVAWPENSTMYYQFSVGQHKSPLGRTRTAPKTLVPNLSFLVVSCSNYQWGYFNAYRCMATEKDIAAVIHLGDYIYEYGAADYFDKKLPIRRHLPPHEIVSESDYQTRYAQYRLDPDLAELHRLFPFISVWDDHEIANDAYKEGAQNHQQEEGDWNERKKNAKKVYFEWLPLKENSSKSIQRKFQFGNLASLYMMDERLEARTKQGMGENDSLRTILGKEQREWFLQEMQKDKNVTWKIWANQVIFSQVKAPDAVTKVTKSKLNSDMWDGYAVEREIIMNNWLAKEIDHVIIVTGDAHVSMGMNLQHQGKKLGEEWVTPSITSANLNERISNFKAKFVEHLFRKKKLNPNLNYCDLRHHGFMLVELNENEAKNTWYYEKTILKPSSKLKKRKVVRWTIGE